VTKEEDKVLEMRQKLEVAQAENLALQDKKKLKTSTPQKGKFKKIVQLPQNLDIFF
jgi:hypothetical protein